MGLGGISPWSLLLILVIVLLLFGTKRLRNMGSDLGGAFRSFKSAIKDKDDEADAAATQPAGESKVTHEQAGRVIDAEAKHKDRTSV